MKSIVKNAGNFVLILSNCDFDDHDFDCRTKQPIGAHSSKVNGKIEASAISEMIRCLINVNKCLHQQNKIVGYVTYER